jgi:predicted TIM-barrel fold metal-dependent hydrolase
MTASAPAGSAPSTRYEVIVSADSHVMEPHTLWQERLPQSLRDQAPVFPAPRLGVGFQGQLGGHDPHARLVEMAQDGVSGEVLYPTLGLTLFSLDDAALQEACFRAYNDWLIEYCQVSHERLVGIAAISTYDIDHAVDELTRCKNAGLQGAIVWQAPHPALLFSSDHYDRLWSACQDLAMPVSQHILTGHSYHKHNFGVINTETYRSSVNLKLLDAANGLFDLIFYGALDRFPSLKLVLVENEIGWIPFILQQWDYYFRRFQKANPPPIDRLPSEFFDRQVYATFFNDSVGTGMLDRWGQDRMMWSNDFPHPNTTWPHSLDVIARDLAHVTDEVRAKLVRENVVELYGMRISQPVDG